MQKKNILRFGIIAVLVAACLIFLSSSARVHEEPTCCKENMNNCPKKKNNPAPAMIWETFSRQFISISPFSY
ncbi:MAG TPA: hypothetical protein VKC90_02045 [Chitinophagaceae bacterium]|nr:hypothetical protein [Chitinophagaceae bacterium]